MVNIIDDLKVDDWIIYKTNKNARYGKIVYFTFPFSETNVQITLESLEGTRYQIDEFTEIEKVSEQLKRELDCYKNTMEEKQKMQQYNTGGLTTSQKANKVPTHYQGSSDIDLIEFFYQQWGMEALKAVVSFNIQRYALRLGRKDEETQELKKIIDYAQRFIDKKETEND